MEFNNQTKIQMTMGQLKIVEEVLQELPAEELVAYSLKSGQFNEMQMTSWLDSVNTWPWAMFS